MGVSEYASDGGVSKSAGKTSGTTALGGNDGRDFMVLLLACFCRLIEFFAVFFRRRCIRDSWHSIQNMPCEVRAYLRFSILFLQFLHRKQLAQKA